MYHQVEKAFFRGYKHEKHVIVDGKTSGNSGPASYYLAVRACTRADICAVRACTRVGNVAQTGQFSGDATDGDSRYVY